MAADITVRDTVAVAVELQAEIFVNQSLDYVAMIVWDDYVTGGIAVVLSRR
jgi:hypothetical protein